MQVTLLVLLIVLLSSCADSGSKNEGATKAAVAAPRGEGARDATRAAEEPRTAKAVARTRIETIQFPAADGLLVTADLYQWHDEDAPFIVLFHQAGWSRGEYKEIAPKLGEMGFNCMAVDQRSGKSVNDVVNESAKLARDKKLGTSYLDALPDMRAALRLVQSRYPDAKRIAWGSSYSSALVLVLAGNEKDLIDAVISFSPGEYFSKLGKGKDFVRNAARQIEQPVFITSSKAEQKSWQAIYAAIPSKDKSSFVPETPGNHGSRALWAKQKDAGAYWAAVQRFLEGL